MHAISATPLRFTYLLKSAISGKHLHLGAALHALYLKSYAPHSTYLSNHFVILYSKCGLLASACRAFDEIPHPNVFSYNALLDAYCKESRIQMAQNLFEQIPHPDLVTYNTLICAYSEFRDVSSAFALFCSMREAGLEMDGFTLSAMISACAWDVCGVKQLHSHVILSGLDSYAPVNNALISGYSNNKCLLEAERIFLWLGELRDEVSWNSMIVAFGQQKEGSKSVKLFQEMVREAMSIDMYTWASLLTAFTSLDDVIGGSQFHGQVMKFGLEKNSYVGSGLVDLYSKGGRILEATRAFEEVPQPDLVLWNTMISGYSQNEEFSEEALECFREMQRNGFCPDDGSFVCVISACSNLSSPSQGNQLHTLALKSEIPTNRISVNNALIAMYSKCGNLGDARKLFDRMTNQNTVTFNSIIAGYAQHGLGMEALILYEKMLEEGHIPTNITFISVLSACGHTGKVDEGWRYFKIMEMQFGIIPEEEHYSCLIDLLGRAGKFDEIEELLKNMPYDLSSIGWSSLLGACRTYGNLELGTKVADEVFRREPENASAYVILANMYASAGRWNEVGLVRKRMKEIGVKKKPGCSWIEVDKKIHVFVADDSFHPRIKEIHQFLRGLFIKMKAAGYVPDTRWALVRENEKEGEGELRLGHHSEKLAVAFGLISTRAGVPILVVKNLRICGDCHNAIKFISLIANREITIRDSHRFHCFKEGICSCGDYW